MAIAENNQNGTQDESVEKSICAELDKLKSELLKGGNLSPQSVSAYRAKLSGILSKIPLKNRKIPAGPMKTKYDRCDQILQKLEGGATKESVEDLDDNEEEVTLESIAEEIIEHGKAFDEMAKKIDLVTAYAYNENQIAIEKANLAVESGELTMEAASELIQEADSSVGNKMQKSVKAALTNSKNYFDKTAKSIGKAASGESGYQKVIDEARALCKKNASVASLQVEYKDYTEESDAILKAQSAISKIIAKGKSKKDLSEEDAEKIKEINTDINKKRGKSKGKPVTTTLSKAIESLDKVVKVIYGTSKDAAESDDSVSVKGWDPKSAKRMADAVSISKRLGREMTSVNLCTALDLKHGINQAIKKGRKQKTDDEKSMSESVELFASFDITDKLKEIVESMNAPAEETPVEESVEINVDDLIQEAVEELAIESESQTDDDIDTDAMVQEAVNDASYDSDIDDEVNSLIQEAVDSTDDAVMEAEELIQEALEDANGDDEVFTEGLLRKFIQRTTSSKDQADAAAAAGHSQGSNAANAAANMSSNTSYRSDIEGRAKEAERIMNDMSNNWNTLDDIAKKLTDATAHLTDGKYSPQEIASLCQKFDAIEKNLKGKSSFKRLQSSSFENGGKKNIYAGETYTQDQIDKELDTLSTSLDKIIAKGTYNKNVVSSIEGKLDDIKDRAEGSGVNYNGAKDSAIRSKLSQYKKRPDTKTNSRQQQQNPQPQQNGSGGRTSGKNPQQPKKPKGQGNGGQNQPSQPQPQQGGNDLGSLITEINNYCNNDLAGIINACSSGNRTLTKGELSKINSKIKYFESKKSSFSGSDKTKVTNAIKKIRKNAKAVASDAALVESASVNDILDLLYGNYYPYISDDDREAIEYAAESAGYPGYTVDVVDNYVEIESIINDTFLENGVHFYDDDINMLMHELALAIENAEENYSDTYNDIMNESILGVDDEVSAIIDEEISADAEESGEGEIDIDAVMSDDDDDDLGDECTSIESVLDDLMYESKSKKKKEKSSDDDEECDDDECGDDEDSDEDDDDDRKKKSSKKKSKKKDDDDDEGDSDTDDEDETDDDDTDGSDVSSSEDPEGDEEGTDSEGSSEPAESEEPVDESVIEEGVIGKLMSGATNATASARIKKLVNDIKKKVAEGKSINRTDDADLDGVLNNITGSARQIESLSAKLGSVNESAEDEIDVDALIEEAAIVAGTSSNKAGTFIHNKAEEIIRYTTDTGAVPSSGIKRFYDDVLDRVSSCCDTILNLLGKTTATKESTDDVDVDIDNMIKEAAEEAGFDYDDNSVDYLLRNFDDLI